MQKPFKPCKKIGCLELTRDAYCLKHIQEKKERIKEYNNARDPKYKQFYNSKEWKTLRKIALSRDNFLCVSCLKNNKRTPADVVDHIEEVKDAWHLRLALFNLQSLCLSCHNTKTFEEKKRREDRNKNN